MRIIQIVFPAILCLRAVVAIAPPLYVYDWELVSGTVDGYEMELIDCITLGHSSLVISGTASCKAYSALVDMTHDGDTAVGTMLVRGLTWTEMSCGGELDAYSQVYLDSLQRLKNFTVEQSPWTKLKLWDDESEWVFARPPEDTECPEPPIPYYPMSDYEGDWYATDAQVDSGVDLSVGNISMRLLGDQISGLSACNAYSGTVYMNDTLITQQVDPDEAGVFVEGEFSVDEFVQTDVYCPEEGVMNLEQQYVDSMSKFDSFGYMDLWDDEAVPTFELTLEGPGVLWTFKRPLENSSRPTDPPSGTAHGPTRFAVSMVGVVALFGMTLA